MRRNGKSIGWIVAAAGLCLAGLLSIQLVLLRRNLEWQSRSFQREAAGALASAAEKLEAKETLKRVMTVSFMNKGEESYAVLAGEGKQPALFALNTRSVPKVRADGGNILLTLGRPQRVRLEVVEPRGKADRLVLDEIRPAGQSVVPVLRLAATANAPGGTGWVRLFLDEIRYDLTLLRGKILSILAHPTMEQSRMALIDKILEQYLVIQPVPLEQRIDAADLREAVTEALQERGIVGECAWGVIPAGRREVFLANGPGWREELLRSGLRTRLYPHDVTVSAGELAFFFPGGEGSVMARLGWPAAAAALFILALASCLYLILRMAAGLKRYAAATAEFVNNMTHEFKTPVSTISLACDALEQPVVQAGEGRQAKYRDMIRAECRRMQDQIGKILETAALEKGDLELNFTRLDAHLTLGQAAEAFVLAAERRGGSVMKQFAATTAVIEADPVHFQNVIRNLLDNAIQYTRRPPEIVLSTATVDGKLRISVADNGIGLEPEARKRVFDKYYRVPTGNVHDVRGYGLGLSYVRLIVKAHGGSVRVESEEGKGSVFTIELPFRRKIPRGERTGEYHE